MESKSLTNEEVHGDSWVPIEVHARDIDLYRTPSAGPFDYLKWLRSLVPCTGAYEPPESFSHVLHGVSVRFRSGEMAAIMGGSGSGKSTLMGVLAGDFSGTSVAHCLKGDVTYNGYDITDTWVARKVKYVQGFLRQLDKLPETLTLIACLRYCALLGLPANMSISDQFEKANGYLRILELVEHKDTMVSRLSGGQKRRLALACQLIKDPAVMFLDEPTTGLDSYTADLVVNTLAKVKKNRTIIVTIHQPAQETLNVFDRVLLLSKGHLVYDGPPETMDKYFDSLGYPCPAAFSPADFYIDLVSIDSRSPEIQKETTDRLIALEDDFRDEREDDSGEYHYIKPRCCTNVVKSPFVKEKGFVRRSGPYAVWKKTARQGRLTLVQTVRGFHRLRSDSDKLMGLFLNVFLLGFLLSLVYTELGDSSGDVFVRNSAIFSLLATNTIVTTLFMSLLDASADAVMMEMEHRDCFSTTFSFIFSRFFVQTVVLWAMTVVKSAIFYYSVGLRSGFQHFITLLIPLLLATSICDALAFACIAALHTFDLGAVVGYSIGTTFLLVSGFLVNESSYKFYHTAISYISFVQYALSAMIISQYDGVEFECSDELKEIVAEQAAEAQAEAEAAYAMEAANAPPGYSPPYMAPTGPPPEMECVVEGKTFIEALGMVTEEYWLNVGALVILLGFFIVLSTILLVMFRRRR